MADCDLNVGINSRLLPLGALDPETILVDERSLLDRLSFCARYAELIVFFDQNNQPDGDWRQFFLKDPIILMAAISTTGYTPKHRMYLLLQKQLKDSGVNWSYVNLTKNPPGHKTLRHLEQLFELINGLFIEINDWLDQMDIGQKSYALRTFVQQQVQTTLAIQLGQLIELQKLCHFVFSEISSPDFKVLSDFNPLWQSTMHTRNLALLDTDADGQMVVDVNVLERLEQIYYQVFGFYVQVVDSAKDSFNELWDDLNQSSDSYPDTALLIAFSQLMQVQQDQLNKLTQSHLNFYYRDILQQNLRPAEGDSVIVCLTLKPKAEPLLLPQGTLFNGGVNAEQQPQLFSSGQSQWFNQIKIEQVQTLQYKQKFDSNKQFINGELFSSVIKDANKVIKDPQGKLRNWSLLGDSHGKLLSQGWAVASPLLSLSGGHRTITLTMDWASDWPVSKEEINSSQFFLSGKKKWLAVKLKSVVITNTSLIMTIELDANEPAIVAFEKNPDGYSSEWPLFKWLLSEQLDLTQPPQMKSLNIDVKVQEFHEIELYNDAGKLSTDSAFLPFGPIPDEGSQFYLGSAEIFSKPLTELKIQLTWQQLPKDMTDYYQTYNQFIANDFTALNQDPPACEKKPFNNAAFKGTFSLFSELQWKSVTVTNALPENSTSVPADEKASLSTCSVFSFSDSALKAHKYDTELLLQPLNFNQPLKPGFIRLQLTSPEYGFGNSQYAKVVAAVTQENSYRLIADSKNSGKNNKKIKNKQIPSNESINVGIPENDMESTNQSVSLFVEMKQAEPIKTPDENEKNKKEDKKESRILSLFHKITGSDKLKKIKNEIKEDIEEVLHSDKLAKAEKDIEEIVDITKDTVNLVDPAAAPAVDKADQLIDDLLKTNTTIIKSNDKDSNKPALLAMPNIPYVPKIASMSLKYQAGKQFDLSKAADYPCELFHYDSFSAYSVYGNNITPALHQSPGLVEQSAGVSLIPGVSSGGCLYLGLNHIQPPCNLSLYFQLDELVAYSSQITPKVDNAKQTTGTSQNKGALKFYYLSDGGWQPLQILHDSTDGLKCSGIVEVFLGADMSKDPSLLPFAKPADKTTDKRGWLAIQGFNHSPEKISDYAKVVYLNSQAVQLTRQFQQPWKQADAPTIAAENIKALVTDNPQVKGVLQPFAADGGQGKESHEQFYRRVSERINNKDRVVALDHFAGLACDALPDLYFCKTINAKKPQQQIQLMLVNGVNDITAADAFQPVVSGCQLSLLKQFFSRRLSPMVRLKLVNPDYEVVKVTAQLDFAANVAINRLCQQIAEQLKIYLSPWIKSTQTQRMINQELSCGELIDFICSWDEVIGVSNLTVTVDGHKLPQQFVIKMHSSTKSILASAAKHIITQTEAA